MGKLYLGTDQLNLVNGSMTLIELDTIPANFTDGIEDTGNHRITPGQAGFYHIIGQVTFRHVVADVAYLARIRLNGNDYKATGTGLAAVALSLTIPVVVHLYLSATDYVELIVVSFSGNNTVDVFGTEDQTFLSLQRVR